jgi:hypothetical protein
VTRQTKRRAPKDYRDDLYVHQLPARTTRSGLVRRARGEGALIAFAAFGDLDHIFEPTPSTPDPQNIRDALNAPDANEWLAAMDLEIGNMRCFNVFREAVRPLDKNIITPK